MRIAIIASVAATLVACTNMPAPKLGPGPPPIVTPKKMATLGPSPVKGAAARFAFAAVTGVPAEMRFTLEKSLKKYAATRSLTLVPEGDPSAVYQVKGYLSAIGDSAGTLLVYVWDVSDSFGTPLYRISGQETGGGSGADPWTGINTTAIDDAARESVDKLADWVSG